MSTELSKVHSAIWLDYYKMSLLFIFQNFKCLLAVHPILVSVPKQVMQHILRSSFRKEYKRCSAHSHSYDGELYVSLQRC